MGKLVKALRAQDSDFIRKQLVFFVASATPDSSINLSPKGLDTLRILSPTRLAYADLTGSGAETAAHLRLDGRLTLLFCSFSDEPMILRLRGHGVYRMHTDPAWAALTADVPRPLGTRGVVDFTIESVQTSCGYGVPVAEALKPRDRLAQWAHKRGDQGLAEYVAKRNTHSVDGLSTGFAGSGPTTTA